MQTNLTVRQRQAAQFLSSGKTGRQTALELGVNTATISTWGQQPAFRQYLDELLIKIERNSLEALHGLRLRAVERLGELLESSNPTVALRASEAILDRSASVRLALIKDEEDSDTLSREDAMASKDDLMARAIKLIDSMPLRCD